MNIRSFQFRIKIQSPAFSGDLEKSVCLFRLLFQSVGEEYLGILYLLFHCFLFLC